jgi:hypothetical protein
VKSEIKFFSFAQILIMLSDLRSAEETRMIDVSEITLERLQLFTERTNTLITIDAPLYGSFMIFNGRVLHRGGTYVEPEKIGNSMGFPAYEHVLAEASRFWILDENGVRRLKNRAEMAQLLEQSQRRSARATAKSATVQPAANG